MSVYYFIVYLFDSNRYAESFLHSVLSLFVNVISWGKQHDKEIAIEKQTTSYYIRYCCTNHDVHVVCTTIYVRVCDAFFCLHQSQRACFLLCRCMCMLQREEIKSKKEDITVSTQETKASTRVNYFPKIFSILYQGWTKLMLKECNVFVPDRHQV